MFTVYGVPDRDYAGGDRGCCRMCCYEIQRRVGEKHLK